MKNIVKKISRYKGTTEMLICQTVLGDLVRSLFLVSPLLELEVYRA